MKKFILFVSMLIAGLCFSQTYVFNGENGDGIVWNDPGNWNTNTVPLTSPGGNVSIYILDGFDVIIPEGLTLYFDRGYIYGANDGVAKLTNRGTFIIDGSYNRYFSSQVEFINEGILQLGTGSNISSSYDLSINDNSKLTNKESGTIISNGIGITQYNGTTSMVLENQGKIQKLGNWDDNFNARMWNTGTIEVLAGSFNSGSDESFLDGGVYIVSENANLNLNKKHRLKGVLSGTVNGTFRLSSNNIVIDNLQTATNNINGNGIWFQSGNLRGPGTFINNTVFTIDEAYIRWFDQELNFVNNGTMNFGAGSDISVAYDLRIHDNSLLKNTATGTIRINGIGMSQHEGTDNTVFENEGLIQKISASTESIS
ncbi:MAG: hypothetical protein WCY63_11610, partial [Weeksellaceae bacterium]